MQSTAVGIFPTVDRAEAAYRELLDAGIDRGDISVMAREELHRGELVDAERREPGGSGAGVGMGDASADGATITHLHVADDRCRIGQTGQVLAHQI